VSHYTVAPLRPQDIEQSRVLLELLLPPATLEKWRQSCEASRKVLVLRNSKNYMQGWCAYQEIDDPVRGRLIDVPFLLVASAADPQGVAHELLRRLQRVYRERNCSAVRIEIAHNGGADFLRLNKVEDDGALYFMVQT
jgi:ribosomal protein S18 acetylase RimI-like enzyme